MTDTDSLGWSSWVSQSSHRLPCVGEAVGSVTDLSCGVHLQHSHITETSPDTPATTRKQSLLSISRVTYFSVVLNISNSSKYNCYFVFLEIFIEIQKIKTKKLLRPIKRFMIQLVKEKYKWKGTQMSKSIFAQIHTLILKKSCSIYLSSFKKISDLKERGLWDIFQVFLSRRKLRDFSVMTSSRDIADAAILQCQHTLLATSNFLQLHKFPGVTAGRRVLGRHHEGEVIL